MIEIDWNWLRLTETDRNLTKNQLEWIESPRESGGKHIEIAENQPLRFRMEGGAKQHLGVMRLL